MYFNNLSSRRNAIIVISGIICATINAIAFLMESRNMVTNILAVVGFLLSAYFFFRQYFYKNVVQWNKASASIKINSYWKGIDMIFADVISIEFDSKELSISQLYGKKSSVDLQGLAEGDIQKIEEIIYKYVDESRITWAS